MGCKILKHHITIILRWRHFFHARFYLSLALAIDDEIWDRTSWVESSWKEMLIFYDEKVTCIIHTYRHSSQLWIVLRMFSLCFSSVSRCTFTKWFTTIYSLLFFQHVVHFVQVSTITRIKNFSMKILMNL